MTLPIGLITSVVSFFIPFSTLFLLELDEALPLLLMLRVGLKLLEALADGLSGAIPLILPVLVFRVAFEPELLGVLFGWLRELKNNLGDESGSSAKGKIILI